MKKGALSVFAAVAVMGLAQAKTVAWYHFDECEPGTMTKEEPTVYNSVDPSVGVGTPMYYWNHDKQTSTTHMPAYSNAFPKGFIWADQKTGAKGALNRCLFLVNPPKRGQYGNGEHGVVSLADDEAFHLQTFTIEMFIKDMVNDETDSHSSEAWVNHCVISKPHSWNIAVSGGSGNGSNTMDWTVYRDAGGTPTAVGWAGTNGNQKPSVLRDGRWHHLAITVDGSDQSAVKIRYYIDYCEMLSPRLDMTGPIYYDNSPIILGMTAFDNSNGGWNGLIDELRISDEVLQPKDFLKFCNANADEDTILYCSYDFFLGNPFFKSVYGYQLCHYVNEIAGTNPIYPKFQWREGADLTKPDYAAEVAGAALRSGLADPESSDNAGTIYPHANSYNQACAMSLWLEDDQVFSGGDFTFETFVRLDALPVKDVYLVRGTGCAGQKGGGSWYVRLLQDGKVTLGINWTKSITTTAAVMADLDWHHIALVSHRSEKAVELYVDHVRIGRIDDGTNYIDPDGATSIEVELYSYSEMGWSEYSVHKAWLDDVRIVKRALDPQEFLTVRPVASLVANVRFEGDYSVAPYGAPVPAGTVASGAAEIVERVPAKTVKDGTGATVVEENAKSVRLSGGVLDFGRNLPLEKADEMTVEFFLRPTSVAAEGAEIMKLATADSTVWSLTLSADRKSLTLKADTAQEAGQELVFEIASWQWWNHIALTFARNEGDTVVTCHQNGLPKTARTLGGTLMTDAPTTFTLGSAGFHGLIDELRVSPSVLPVERFMVCPDAPGLTLILK